jgi:hypothetical protein
MKRFSVVLLSLLVGVSVLRGAEPRVGFRFDFTSDDEFQRDWRFYNTMPVLPNTRFRVERVDGATDGYALVVESGKSSGFVITMPRNLDLREYPILRWRWRIVRRLRIADNVSDPDDQAGVVYIADGTNLRHSSVGYRWEHNTLVGDDELIKYRGGLTTVKAICVRNRHTPTEEWVVEERDVVRDFKAAFGKTLSAGFAVTIGANTQHSQSDTRLEIDYIEFRRSPVSPPEL